MKPITIKDIARTLGMSHSTVSRALSDHPQVSQETKAAVRLAAENVGYVPNASGRIIRGEPGTLIGLVIPDVRNDFYSAIAKGLAERCRVAGRQLVLAITEDDAEAERNEVQSLIGARAAGIVITPSPSPSARTLAMLTTVPTVQLVRNIGKLKTDTVSMNDKNAIREATEHLFAAGHRRLGYVGTYADVSAGRHRFEGFRCAHANAGIVLDADAVALVPPREGFGFESTMRLLDLKNRPTGIVVGSSELTVGALKCIASRGLSVPGDIAVVGYGDPEWYQLLPTPLTAMRLPVDDLADAVVNCLFKRIDALRARDDKKVRLTHISIDPVLIVRQSTRR